MELKNKLTEITKKAIEEKVKKEKEKAEVWFNKIIKNLPIEMEKKAEKGKDSIYVYFDNHYENNILYYEESLQLDLITEWAKSQGLGVKKIGLEPGELGGGVVIKWIDTN